MPETLDRVEAILGRLCVAGLFPAAVLVVPGRDWGEAGISRLRAWANAGHALVAHGWHHETRPRRLGHRLHAAVLSRNVAEHLDLDSAGILGLMRRSHDWFGSVGLPVPDVYVPPAWALGRMRRGDLARAPFSVIETVRGVWFPGAADRPRFRELPLAGFEADTWLREHLLRQWNRLQWHHAMQTRQPLRLSIHPRDLELRLSGQLGAMLATSGRPLGYGELTP